MPESDVTKMKVADLKRELKLRGLSLTGNKNELQERLQTALIEGDISLDDSALTGDDLLDDEDGVLTDEDETKLLVDENELLKSPASTPTSIATDTGLLSSPFSKEPISSITSVTLLTPATAQPPGPAKKIVLKRANSQTGNESTKIAITTKDSTEPSVTTSTNTRKLITIGNTLSDEIAETGKKVTQLTTQERLELRAKKFGITSVPATATDRSKLSKASIVENSGSNDPKQIEMLKKRAERFGCVVSSKIAKLDAEEKLLKRKERFGGGESEGKVTSNPITTPTTVAVTTTGSDDWAEKKRLRLERFKSTGLAATPTESK